MGADVLQRLLVLTVFVAGVVEKGLDDLTAVTQVMWPLVRQHFFILHLAWLKSREPSKCPCLQPLQLF